MMGYSDQCSRYFLRLLAPASRHYTEMISLEALVRGANLRQLDHDHEEYPLTLQIGGNSVDKFETLESIIKDSHFSEININAGCPSKSVLKGEFGISLFANSDLLSQMVTRLKEISNRKISVKTRIGKDFYDEEVLHKLVGKLVNAGCDSLVMHARIALSNLSPSQNRSIPSLDYGAVSRLRSVFPKLSLVINGGINQLSIAHKLAGLGYEGIMVGRAFIRNPLFIRSLQSALTTEALPTLEEAITKYLMWGEMHCAKKNTLPKTYTRPLSQICSHFYQAAQLRKELLHPEITFTQLKKLALAMIGELADKPDSV